MSDDCELLVKETGAERVGYKSPEGGGGAAAHTQAHNQETKPASREIRSNLQERVLKQDFEGADRTGSNVLSSLFHERQSQPENRHSVEIISHKADSVRKAVKLEVPLVCFLGNLGYAPTHSYSEVAPIEVSWGYTAVMCTLIAKGFMTSS